MNFVKESKSKDIFFLRGGSVCGGGGGGGGGQGSDKKKNNMYSLTFCAHALYKISSS